MICLQYRCTLSDVDKTEISRQILQKERAQIIQPSDTTEFNSAVFTVNN